MNISILYEDEYIVAVNKPASIMVHGDGRGEEYTLVDWIKEKYPEIMDVGESETMQNGEVINRPGIVHRLDRDTSGVIIIAKTKDSHTFIKEQFQNRKVKKIYHSLVWGCFSPEKMEGVIDKPIGRSASDFRKWSAEFGAKGELREAITEYKVLAQNKDCAYIEIYPKTGRTHQIRVHMKAISHPVVCDKIYGTKKETIFGFTRLALHALSIKLELPNRSFIQIESPLPDEFKEALDFLKK